MYPGFAKQHVKKKIHTMEAATMHQATKFPPICASAMNDGV